MGSFNTKCFASNQTIAPGDKCYVIPIRQQSTFEAVEVEVNGKTHSVYGPASSTCHPDAFWTPVTMPLAATYDDYGLVELSDTKHNRYLLQRFFAYLQDSAAVTKQGSNEWHDTAFNLKQFVDEKAPNEIQCWQYFHEAVRSQRVFLASRHGRIASLGVAIMHERAYAKLLEMQSAGTSWNGMPLELRKYFDACVAECRTKENSAEDAFYDGDFQYQLIELLRQANGSSLGYLTGQDLLVYGCQKLAKGEISEEKAFDAIKPLLEFWYVNAGLEALNIQYAPQVVAAQDYSNEVGQAYQKFVSDVAVGVSRDCAVRSYGEFSEFTVRTSDFELGQRLTQQARDFDMHVNVLSSRWDEASRSWLLKVEATTDQAGLDAALKGLTQDKPDCYWLMPQKA